MSFWELFKSPVAIAGFSAWFLAQVLKVPVEYLRHKEWNWALWASAGGMPSSHSALMTGVTLSIGHYHGWGTPLFVLALAVSGIVIYDATGVRRQAGLQAKRLNLLINDLIKLKTWPREEEIKDLREMIGHTWGEALGGMLFGLVVSIVVWLIIPVTGA